MRHVISISPSGVAVGLHLDAMPLSFLGPMKASRASDIVLNEATQKWEVCVVDQTAKTTLRAVPSASGFYTYEEARRFEVRWLNNCREFGIDPWSPAGQGVFATSSREAHDADKLNHTQ